MRNPIARLVAAALVFVLSFTAAAQSPGLIVRPAGGNGITPLNPNGNAYSSATTSGFTSNDITESKVPFKIVPPAVIEPTGDLATGPSGGFTDIVKTIDNSGFYMYKDATNIYFRLRIGAISSGSKGYSVLIDTDGKIGNTGPYAEDKYVAPTNAGSGNPGFEYEVVLRTNFEVSVYDLDGVSNPVLKASFPLATHSQISVALSTDGNNPDYFYDWYVPLSAIGSPSNVRLAATTVTSPSSALQGSRSDIYGIDDAAYTNTATGWTALINAQPIISLTNFSTYSNSIGAACTAAPTITAPVNTGTNVTVSGTWTRMDASKPNTTTIRLYRNNIEVGTTTVSSGGTWSIAVATVTSGDIFYTQAQSEGESKCLQSNSVKVIGCSAASTSTTTGLTFDMSCFNEKGMSGTRPAGASVKLYTVTSSGTPTLLADDATTQFKITYPSATEWRYDGQNNQGQQQKACSGGQNDILPAQYMITATETNKCESGRVNACLGLSTTQAAPTIAQTTLTEASTTVSGTVATAGSFVRLYINGIIAFTTTITGNNYSFNNLTLLKGDLVEVRAQAIGQCLSATVSKRVECYTQQPLISLSTTGNILATATSISGRSAYPGSTVMLNKGVAPSGVSVGTAVVNTLGVWTVTGLTLVAGETYYATQSINGCSATSPAVTISAVTTVCPTITGTYTENSISATGGFAFSFTGTVRLYLDGAQIGTATVTNATTWIISSFAYPLYPGGQLTVRGQAGTAAETSGCPAATATITCAMPAMPTLLSPAQSTINVGQMVTYNVTNLEANAWYAVLDGTGKSYATSLFNKTGTSVSLTTNPIVTAGTFDLKITADKLNGCGASFTTARIIANQVVLPVRFVNVSARINNNQPVITWQVAEEMDVAYYSVERSLDGQTFEEKGKVPFKASGPVINEYQFTDKDWNNGDKVYYRIRQVDHNGKAMYSKVVSLTGLQALTMQVHPNPATTKTVVQFNSNYAQAGKLQLVNASGLVVVQQAIQLKKGSNTFVLDDLQKLTRGVYFVKMLLPSDTYYQKIILQ